MLINLLKANNETGYFVGDDLTVADLKVFCTLNFLVSGFLKNIPANLVSYLLICLFFKNQKLLYFCKKVMAVSASEIE